MPLPAILDAKSHCRRQYVNMGGAMPRPYRRILLAPRVYEEGAPERGRGGKLAPRVYEGGAPIGAGGAKHCTELPQSPPCGGASPLLKAGAKGVCMIVGGAMPRPYKECAAQDNEKPAGRKTCRFFSGMPLILPYFLPE